jgi:hypothetical protein
MQRGVVLPNLTMWDSVKQSSCQDGAVTPGQAGSHRSAAGTSLKMAYQPVSH